MNDWCMGMIHYLLYYMDLTQGEWLYPLYVGKYLDIHMARLTAQTGKCWSLYVFALGQWTREMTCFTRVAEVCRSKHIGNVLCQICIVRWKNNFGFKGPIVFPVKGKCHDLFGASWSEASVVIIVLYWWHIQITQPRFQYCPSCICG